MNRNISTLFQVITVFLFMLSGMSSTIMSQGRWENYVKEPALLSATTNCLFCDAAGNVWFGHENGVTVYDGLSFNRITSAGMMDSPDIKSIDQDDEGNIWFATSEGALKYDGDSYSKYTVFNGLISDVIYVVMVDSEGGIWFGTDEGVSRFYDNQWTSYSDQNGLLNNHVNCLHEDIDGNIWVGHEHSGISIFYGDRWEHHENFQVADITSDPGGNVIVSSLENNSGIFIFDGDSFTEEYASATTVYDLFFDSDGTLWTLGESSIGHYEGNDYILDLYDQQLGGMNRSICEDGNSNLYFGGCEYVYRLESGDWNKIGTWVGQDIQNVTEIQEDIFGNVILGSWNSLNVYNDGIWSIPDYLEGFNGPWVSLLTEEDSILWIGTSEAIHYYRNDFHYEFNMPPGNIIRNLFKDSEGTVWACSDSGLYHFTGSVWMKDNVQMYYFGDLEEDREGKLWIGGSEIKTFDGVSSQDVADIPTNDILVDSAGDVWIAYGNSRGVVRYDGDKWIHYADTLKLHPSVYESWTDFADTCGLTSNNVFDIFEDSRGNIWFATSNGVDKYSNGYWFHYDTTDGLVNQNARVIYEDSRGQLWFGTSQGVSKLIPFSETVVVLTTHVTCTGGNDGVLDIRPEFLNPPYTYSIDGGDSFSEDSLYEDLIAGEYHVIVRDGNGEIAIDDYVSVLEPESEFGIDISHVSCYGMEDGSINLTVEGDGVSPISYQWSNDSVTGDISNLAAGMYSVTISYDICEFTRDIEVKQPDSLVATSIIYNICTGSLLGGADLSVDGGTKPYSFAWSDGSLLEDLDQAGPGSYTVMITDAKGCQAVDTVEVVKLEEDFAINISASHGKYLCEDQTVLEVPDGFPYYRWLNGYTVQSDSSIFKPVKPGVYTVTVLNANNCRSQDTIEIVPARTNEFEDICMVTVEESGKNMILWNRTPDMATNMYNIYRETEITDQYVLIGQSGFSKSGYFIDQNSNPDQQSYRYKLAVIDTCGNESKMSPHHSTIHLTRNLAVDLKVNLIWSKYEGFKVTSYNIWKGSGPSNLTNIGSVSGNNFTFTDQNPNLGITYYAVEVVSPNSCNPDGLKSTFTSSFSNIVSVDITGTGGDEWNKEFSVYPNPVGSICTITVPALETDFLDLYLYDITGRLVVHLHDLKGPEIIFRKQQLPDGLYQMKVTGNRTYSKRILIH